MMKSAADQRLTLPLSAACAPELIAVRIAAVLMPPRADMTISRSREPYISRRTSVKKDIAGCGPFALVARQPLPAQRNCVEFVKGLSLPVTRIGLEADPLSQWLHASLIRAGFETVLLETRHVKAVFMIPSHLPAEACTPTPGMPTPTPCATELIFYSLDSLGAMADIGNSLTFPLPPPGSNAPIEQANGMFEFDVPPPGANK